MKKWIAVLLPLLPVAAWAEAFSGDVEKQAVNMPAIIMFFIFVGATLYITYWAARQTKSTKDFYTAGGGISGFRNGLAIAGDYMSAASFLGISAMVYTTGFDGLIYSTGFLRELQSRQHHDIQLRKHGEPPLDGPILLASQQQSNSAQNSAIAGRLSPGMP